MPYYDIYDNDMFFDIGQHHNDEFRNLKLAGQDNFKLILYGFEVPEIGNIHNRQICKTS